MFSLRHLFHLVALSAICVQWLHFLRTGSLEYAFLTLWAYGLYLSCRIALLRSCDPRRKVLLGAYCFGLWVLMTVWVTTAGTQLLGPVAGGRDGDRANLSRGIMLVICAVCAPFFLLLAIGFYREWSISYFDRLYAMKDTAAPPQADND